MTDRLKALAKSALERVPAGPLKDAFEELAAGRVLRASRKSLAVQLYLGLGGAVALTLGTSVVGWVSFQQVGELNRRVADSSVPDMAAAFSVAQHVGALVEAAPRLTVADSPEEFQVEADEVRREEAAFERRLDDLATRRGESEGVRRVRIWGREMAANIQAIEESVGRLAELADISRDLQLRLRDLDLALSTELVTALDDQFFFAMTGYRELGRVAAARESHFNEEQFDRYRRLTVAVRGATAGMLLLSNTFDLTDPDQLVPLRERYESSARAVFRSVAALGPDTFGPDAVNHLEMVRELSGGADGIFATRSLELELQVAQRELLTDNRQIAFRLLEEVESLVSSFRSLTLDATQTSTAAVNTGRTLLLVLNVISIVGAGLIAWLFIGRHLLSRLERLSTRMRYLAHGDLEGEVKVEGTDEIADMASALEVFRRHALEIQRLNLVEKLAEDLRAKNAEMEAVVADLRKAQDQIIMREKLAALGELTAGVAHEIKNPLNFVKNFSEVSEELLEELLEVLPPAGSEMTEDSHIDIDEICEDLTGNLQSIRQHGIRADRIVQDMLMMGRGSSDKRATKINSLVKEHADLAYHSARAIDPNFQLHIENSFDPALAEVEIKVIPQDLGRVVLNMVSNACHATDEKRHASDGSYLPMMWVTTQLDGDHLKIRVKDNGSGIPEEVVDKIFNPFFTTKAADKGTGLGLALSNDIVREHGGAISVDTKPGEYTEMTVDIPVAAADTVDQSPA